MTINRALEKKILLDSDCLCVATCWREIVFLTCRAAVVLSDANTVLE